MNEMVSVIIPTWNREKTLKNAISSILSQTYQNFEILICDDSSSDGSFDIVENLKKSDYRIKWVPSPSKSNSGLPAIPRNRGIKLAKGDWIAFLDSDDTWHPEKLERQIDYLERNNLRICSSNANIFKNNKKIDKLVVDFPRNLILFEDLCLNNFVICSSVVLKKKVLDKIGGFDEGKTFKAVEDYLLWLKIAVSHEIGFLNEALVNYNDMPLETVRGTLSYTEVTQRNIEIFNALRNFVEENGPKETLIKIKKLGPKKNLKYYFKKWLARKKLNAAC
jgi:teichuronic acid biosynthesis glycosyltransferase TuaG